MCEKFAQYPFLMRCQSTTNARTKQAQWHQHWSGVRHATGFYGKVQSPIICENFGAERLTKTDDACGKFRNGTMKCSIQCMQIEKIVYEILDGLKEWRRVTLWCKKGYMLLKGPALYPKTEMYIEKVSVCVPKIKVDWPPMKYFRATITLHSPLRSFSNVFLPTLK